MIELVKVPALHPGFNISLFPVLQTVISTSSAVQTVSVCHWHGAVMVKQTVWMEAMKSSVLVFVDLTRSPVRVETSVSSTYISVMGRRTAVTPLMKVLTIVVRSLTCTN